jgi:excisionase family DNA binding protein
MTKDREYLTAEEVARALQVPPETILRWANDGLMRCVTAPGGQRRFLRAEIDEVVARLEYGVHASSEG